MSVYHAVQQRVSTQNHLWKKKQYKVRAVFRNTVHTNKYYTKHLKSKIRVNKI